MKSRPCIDARPNAFVLALLLWTFYAASAWAGSPVISFGAFQPAGINANGDSVGTETKGTETHAYIWKRNASAPTDLGTLTGGTYSIGYGINDDDQTCGQASNSGGGAEAFWFNGISGSAIESLHGPTSSGNAINDNGQVAGRVFDLLADTAYAIEWDTTSGTPFLPLGDGSDGTISAAEANNANGDVGGAATIGSETRGFMATSSGVVTYLGLVGYARSIVRALNDDDRTVGDATDTSTNVTVSFVYEPDSIPTTQLPLLPNGKDSSARAINDRGLIAGYADTSEAAGGALTTHAVMWVPGTDKKYQIVDLNSLIPSKSGWVLTSASGINDSDEIVGSGTLNGANTGFLLDLGHGIDISYSAGAPGQLSTFFTDLEDNLPSLALNNTTTIIPHQDGHYVIVGGWGGAKQNPFASLQLAAAAAAKLPTASYTLLDFRIKDSAGNAVRDGAAQVIEALRAIGNVPTLGFMAVDVESANLGTKANPIPNLPSNINTAAGQAAATTRAEQAVNEVLAAGLSPVIYTNVSAWGEITGAAAKSSFFAALPLWEARYYSSGNDNLDFPKITSGYLGAWTSRAGRQYTNTSTLTDPTTLLAVPVDMNVFDRTIFRSVNPGYKWAAPLSIPSNSVALTRINASTVSAVFDIVNHGTLELSSGGRINSATLDKVATTTQLGGGYGPVPGATATAYGVVKVTLLFTIPEAQKGSSAALSVAATDICGDPVVLSSTVSLP